jgi:hypothetical protein
MRKSRKTDRSATASPTASRAPIPLLALPNTPRGPAPGPSAAARSPAPATLHLELARKLEALPKDLGVALMGLGVVGVAIPGPVPLGASFILMGAAFLWPGSLARFGGWLARRLPGIVRLLINFVDHLRSDLNRRYPGSVRA